MICRTCRKAIRWSEALGRWGHAVNPTWQHHYAKPIRVAPESEGEHRAAWGNR